MHLRNLTCPVLLALTLCGAAVAQPQCTTDTVRGTWAFAELGWTVPLGSGLTAVASPSTVIGVASIEYSGRMTGSGTFVSGTGITGTPIPAGEPIDFTFQGTVEITPDCTGVLRYSLTVMGQSIPGQFIERFYHSLQRDEMVSMSIQSPLSKPLWIGKYTRLGRTPASIAWPVISR